VSVWAVLAAAGRGERLGYDRPKAFAPLGGRPLLAESLERLENSEWVEFIVIAAPAEWLDGVLANGGAAKKKTTTKVAATA